jgi:hypothetical protein
MPWHEWVDEVARSTEKVCVFTWWSYKSIPRESSKRKEFQKGRGPTGGGGAKIKIDPLAQPTEPFSGLVRGTTARAGHEQPWPGLVRGIIAGAGSELLPQLLRRTVARACPGTHGQGWWENYWERLVRVAIAGLVREGIARAGQGNSCKIWSGQPLPWLTDQWNHSRVSQSF